MRPDDIVFVGSDGFVRLVDWMGNDTAIVQAARVSYGEGTKTSRSDRGLIRYLMRNGHTSPFEMCEIKFHVRVPMDIWRQWIRHRTANVNEYSTRYSEAIDSASHLAEWRSQSSTNKQGSGEPLDEFTQQRLSIIETAAQEGARESYRLLLEHGVAREQARKVLPLSTYTEAYWKIDLHNLLHFLRLRLDKHAQKEIRDFANAIASFVRDWVPLVWEAFEDYRCNSITFSAADVRALSYENGQLGIKTQEASGLNKGEYAELCSKLWRLVRDEENTSK